ncbi:MAG TPA: phosphatase PAP2 family protein [Nitrososphaerales archaeon]|nr:phosphatase PAP2 family protein [Nitrososphaerales archaeon]
MTFESFQWVRYNSYSLLVAGYCSLVLLSYVYFGLLFQYQEGLVSLALIPLVYLVGLKKQSLRDWVRFVILMLSYEALQGVTTSLVASRGLFSIYPIDRMLWGVNLTGQIQNFFYSNIVTYVATTFYGLHLFLVVVLALTLWFTRKTQFKSYVYAVVISSYFCLVVFVLVPTSPPWYLGVAVDLLQKPGAVPSSVAPTISWIDESIIQFVADKFAAFPSMHAAYAVLFGYYMTRVRRSFALFAIPVMIGILFSTLYLGQHYLLDLIGGAAVALGSIAISNRLVRNLKDSTATENMRANYIVNSNRNQE